MSTANSDASDRFVRWIGDLDHPFYDDERNRFVWYEGSAAAFQFTLVGTFGAATIAVLALGAGAIPWVVLMLLPVVLGSVILVRYTERHKSTYAPSFWDLRRRRTWLAMAVTGSFVAALVAVQWTADRAIAIAMLCGAAFGLAGVLAGVRHEQRSSEHSGD